MKYQDLEKIKEIARDYKNGVISLSTAKVVSKFYIDNINEKNKQIAKKYNKRPQLVSFNNFIR